MMNSKYSIKFEENRCNMQLHCQTYLLLLLCAARVLALPDDCVEFERNFDEDTYNTMTLEYTKACLSLSASIQQMEQFTLECNVKNCFDVYTGKLMSLHITKFNGGRDIPIAEIYRENGYTGPSEIINLIKTVKVSGHLRERETSFLRTQWVYSKKYDLGSYRCILNVKNLHGQNITIIGHLNIQSNESLKGLIRQSDNPNPTQLSQVSTDTYTSQYQTRGYYIISNEDCYGSLEMCRQKVIADFFHEPMIHNSKKYYLFKGSFNTDVESDGICDEVLGGYLVEIDDAAEYNAMASNLSDHKVVGALVGGFTPNGIDPWIFRQSGKVAMYFRWFPKKNIIASCLFIATYINNSLAMTYCSNQDMDLHFICETSL